MDTPLLPRPDLFAHREAFAASRFEGRREAG